jgi:ABC-2 type transport system permease protein
MKATDIALKDMIQAFRSRTALVFMFVVPILEVANLDEGAENLGDVLVQGLAGGEIPIPIDVTMAADADSARRAVDLQRAGVAVIIPEEFSTSVISLDGRAEVELYQDPTLTLGPSIISSIVNAFVDGFSGSKITVGVAVKQLSANGLFPSPADIEAIIGDYIEATVGTGGADGLIDAQLPSGEEESDPLAGMIQMIMAGMLIFYAFFTGANMVNSILKEEEEGTLARLFTTPTPQRTILYGKFMAAGFTVFIQVLVLLIFGRLVFDFDWGHPLVALSAGLGIAISSATFGIFVISLLKSSRQTGIAMGGGLTVTGMIGMMRVFTVSIPNAPSSLTTLSFLAPQGWALNALTTSMDGGSIGPFLGTLGGLLAWSFVFFFIGNRRFEHRFA